MENCEHTYKLIKTTEQFFKEEGRRTYFCEKCGLYKIEIYSLENGLIKEIIYQEVK